MMRRVCELNAQWCFALGERLVATGRDEEARKAYERGVEHSKDRVLVANGAEWLVHHYLDRGETARALALGEMMADVYSGPGLAAMGHLQERLGDFPQAVDYYQKIQQRYQNPSELHSFFIRYQIRHGGGRYRAETDSAIEMMFPLGLKQVGMADLEVESRLPEIIARSPRGMTDAVVGRLEGDTLHHFGAREGDRVVALDGYRVRNWDQYRCVRSFSDSPRMTAIVWRDGRFVRVTGIYKRRSFAPMPRGMRHAPRESRDTGA